MIKDIWIITNYNLYESKRYFASKLSEALRRQGIETQILDLPDYDVEAFRARPKPDLICSFNRTFPDEQGLFFWDRHNIPMLSFLVDPAIYDANILKSPYALVSCVDQFDCELVQNQGFDRAFFWPHAVERELAFEATSERPYDVVFLGSSYDPEGLRDSWQKRYSKAMQVLILEAAEETMSKGEIPFWKAVGEGFKQRGMESNTQEFVQVCNDVDQYVRGIDRIALICAIKNVSVHVFGGTCWREQTPIRGWAQCLKNCPHVHVHPSISFAESLVILKQSKICLNSMPFFKRGTHERIFTGLACGCLVLTTDNLWVQENFEEGRELLTYRSKEWSSINENIHYFLQHSTERQEVASRGREKVMREHTWDKRVEQLVIALAELMPRIKRTG